MIGKITKGSDFAGLLAYLTKNGRGEVMGVRHLASNTPDEMASEMALTASLSARTLKPVIHISLNYSRNEEPSRADLLADAEAALTSLGLEHNQAVIIRHDDRDHTHFHIAVNRVGPDGKTVHDGNSYARIESTLRRIETERGWAVTYGRNAPAPNGLRFTGYASRPDPRQHNIPAAVKLSLLEAKSEVDLRQRLSAHGWRYEITRRPGRFPGLLLISPQGARIAASKIDRQASYSNLQRRWGRTVRQIPKQPTQKTRKAYKRRHAKRLAWTLVKGTAAIAMPVPVLRRYGLHRSKRAPFSYHRPFW